MIRVPQSWPTGLVAVIAMVTLAVLDLAGSYLAKESVVQRSLPIGVAGASMFVLLFWVYASSLQYAELAPITFGWIVILQVGVILLDRFRYGVAVTPGKWVAIFALLVIQGYLLVDSAISDQTDLTLGQHSGLIELEPAE
jgi:hypothetical protein